MKTSKIIFSLLLGIALLVVQAGTVFAAPALQEGAVAGTVTALECGTDSEGNTIILVTVEDAEGTSQQAGISVELAVSLGLVNLDEGGMPDCDPEEFTAILDGAPEEGLEVEIPSGDIIPVDVGEEEMKHPVGYALSLFFEEIADYEAIMEAHENGAGFGVIAQALWMTSQMESEIDFADVLLAKETGDYSNFVLEDGSTPQNWGQLKKAFLNKAEKNNLGSVMSDKDNDEDTPNNGNGADKDKNKGNNGKGQEKDKNKGKDKKKD